MGRLVQAGILEFAVGFRDDFEEARHLIVEAVRGVEGVLADPAPSAIYTGVGAHGVTVRARWWTDSKRGIEIVYPTQQVLFHDQTEEVDGDRRRQGAGWPAGRGDARRARAASPTRSQGSPRRMRLCPPTARGPPLRTVRSAGRTPATADKS